MRIGIVGCGGRLGRLLVQEVAQTEGCALGGGTGRAGSAVIGRDVAQQAGLAPAGLAVTADGEALFTACDAVIDFSVASAAPSSADLAARHGVPLVLGTTGIGAEDQSAVAAAAAKTAIVQPANTSLGMNVVLALAERAAAALGTDYDVEILGQQHRHKVDAPSGASLALARAAAAGRGVVLDQVEQRGRLGDIGRRPRGAIGLATVSGGDLSVIHTAIFAGTGERLEVTHRGSTRAIYPKGAVRAARWAVGRPAGLYSMAEVLDLV
ncbi:MAG: 4-hydroxy-tetrahydrodipicolinate reductase [Rhodospirillales bacterium]|nr:4-hydroxy-tetrahydrodipicolinate reductase [Rhodospirillales bacterium]